MLFPSALTEVGIHSRGFCGQESSAMPAVFQDVSAAAGVDEGATPFPGMIVPVGRLEYRASRGRKGFAAPSAANVENRRAAFDPRNADRAIGAVQPGELAETRRAWRCQVLPDFWQHSDRSPACSSESRWGGQVQTGSRARCRDVEADKGETVNPPSTSPRTARRSRLSQQAAVRYQSNGGADERHLDPPGECRFRACFLGSGSSRRRSRNSEDAGPEDEQAGGGAQPTVQANLSVRPGSYDLM